MARHVEDWTVVCLDSHLPYICGVVLKCPLFVFCLMSLANSVRLDWERDFTVKRLSGVHGSNGQVLASSGQVPASSPPPPPPLYVPLFHVATICIGNSAVRVRSEARLDSDIFEDVRVKFCNQPRGGRRDVQREEEQPNRGPSGASVLPDAFIFVYIFAGVTLLLASDIESTSIGGFHNLLSMENQMSSVH